MTHNNTDIKLEEGKFVLQNGKPVWVPEEGTGVFAMPPTTRDAQEDPA